MQQPTMKLTFCETGSDRVADPPGMAWRVDLVRAGGAEAGGLVVICGGEQAAEPPREGGGGFYEGRLVSDTDAEPVRPPSAGALYLVAFEVPAADAPALEDWYATEHVPQMMRVPGWRRIQCMRAERTGGRPFTHLALHWVDGPATLDLPERKAASLGPKRDLICARDWFVQGGRWIYEMP